MKKAFTLRIRFNNPLRLIHSIVVTVSLIILSAICQELCAAPKLDSYYPDSVPANEYKINGWEYKENGIIFDIPKAGDPSRDATVVSFPNNAVIPGHISVNGVRYTVKKIYQAANTWLCDTTGWVTLPPTVKDCTSFIREYSTGSSYYNKKILTIGVSNINIVNLDSFLNMDAFYQIPPYDNTDKYPLKWKLYLNGKQVHDIVYPEGASLKASVGWADGINSITIPASDTARKEPLDYYHYGRPKGGIKKIQFKADSGYDLRYYNIIADSIVMPRGLTEFHGYATLCYNTASMIVARWPDNLKVLANTKGLKNLTIQDVPRTVIKVGEESKITFVTNDDTYSIPQNWEEIYNCWIDWEIRLKKITIEDNDSALIIKGSESYLGSLDHTSATIYIGRNIIFDDAQSKWRAKAQDKTATIVLGDKVTEMPDRLPIVLTDNESKTVKPKYLVCMGTTPPNFSTPLPEILDWKLETVLVVPEEAEQVYKNHPVWKYFYIIMTHDVNEINADKDVKMERWYSLDGQVLTEPERGKINIRVITYTDGTQSRQKIAVPQ